MSQSYQWIWPVLNVGIVVVGWRILYSNARRIATRNETRSILNRVVNTLREIENSAKEFWLKQPDELTDSDVKIWALKIQSEIQYLEESIVLLKVRKLNIDVSTSVFQLRHFATFSCEDKKKNNIEPDVSRVLSISQQSSAILKGLEDSFMRIYAPN